MTDELLVRSVGAVTPVGLTAVQTCAAIRAGVSGVEALIAQPPPVPAFLGARVPAHASLKRSLSAWLANLAARAIRECLAECAVLPPRVVLLLAAPEEFRDHPGLEDASGAALLRAVEARLSTRFHDDSSVLRQGHASTLLAISLARRHLARRQVDAVLIGGVDSLLAAGDISRLQERARLHSPDNPFGLIPGEGAAFALLAPATAEVGGRRLSTIRGIGLGQEQDTVLGDRFSAGAGLQSAIRSALDEAALPESVVCFRVTDVNGERYRSWESSVTLGRIYRTQRGGLPVWHLPQSTGDIGVASAALAVVFASVALARGYAPGPNGMCEASSEGALRAACIIGSCTGNPSPPFRSTHYDYAMARTSAS